MDILPIGKLIKGNAERDAIHVAIAPTVAPRTLHPGQHVGIDGGEHDPIGIVDPYLTHQVVKGERFWLFLYPNTVTSIRHHWTHPAFERGSEAKLGDRKAESKKWMESFAASAGMDYHDAIERAAEVLDHGLPWVENGSDMARDAFYTLEEPGEFWRHYEVLTGRKAEIDEHGEWPIPYSCSC